MISRDEAMRIAREYVRELEADIGFPLTLVEEHVHERALGWAFVYNTTAFVRDGEETMRLAGNSPILVLRADGRLIETDPRHSLEFHLKKLERDTP